METIFLLTPGHGAAKVRAPMPNGHHARSLNMRNVETALLNVADSSRAEFCHPAGDNLSSECPLLYPWSKELDQRVACLPEQSKE